RAGAVDGREVDLARPDGRVLDGIPGLVGEFAEVHLEGVRRLREHPDVGAGAEDALLTRGDHDGADLRVLEAEPLDRVVELDVHTEVVRVELQLVPRPEPTVLPHVHRERGDGPVEGELPVLVPRRVGLEVDAHGVAVSHILSPRATGLSENDPERLGPLRAEILPAVRRAAVEQRAVTGLEQVTVAVIVQGDLAVDHVEELHLTGFDDDLLGRDPALPGPERRDDRADLALEEPGAQHRPALRRAVEADDGIVLPAGHDDRAGGLAVEQGADRHAERRRDPAERMERRREPPRLDLRHHARREVRLLRELALLQLALGAQALDAPAPTTIRASRTTSPSIWTATATPSTGKSNEPRRRSFRYAERQPSAGGSRMSVRISSGRFARYSMPSSRKSVSTGIVRSPAA